MTPSRADAGVQRAIVAAVAAAAAALGLAHGPIHAECRVSPSAGGEPPRVHVLEVAARPIGGSVLEGAAFHVGRLVAAVARARAARSRPRRDVAAPAREDRRRGGDDDSDSAPRDSAVGGGGGSSARRSAHVEDVRITAKQDQLLEPLPEAGSYLGFVFARAPLPSEAEAAVREAHRRLEFTVDAAIDVRAG